MPCRHLFGDSFDPSPSFYRSNNLPPQLSFRYAHGTFLCAFWTPDVEYRYILMRVATRGGGECFPITKIDLSSSPTRTIIYSAPHSTQSEINDNIKKVCFRLATRTFFHCSLYQLELQRWLVTCIFFAHVCQYVHALC